MHLLSTFSLNLPLYEHKKRPSYNAKKQQQQNKAKQKNKQIIGVITLTWSQLIDLNWLECYLDTMFEGM